MKKRILVLSIQKNIDITIFVILLIFSGATYLGMSHLFKKTFGYDTVEMLVKLLR